MEDQDRGVGAEVGTGDEIHREEKSLGRVNRRMKSWVQGDQLRRATRVSIVEAEEDTFLYSNINRSNEKSSLLDRWEVDTKDTGLVTKPPHTL